APWSRTARRVRLPPARLPRLCFSRCSLLGWSAPARYVPKRSVDTATNPSRRHGDELSRYEAARPARRVRQEPPHDTPWCTERKRRRRELALQVVDTVLLAGDRVCDIR